LLLYKIKFKIKLIYLKDRRSLEKKFKASDINKNGTIDFEEFKQMILNLFSMKIESDEIKRMFRLMDTDNDGQITLNEFIKGMNPDI
jgi:Ca2+-binding EF-hand superfamily protein